MPGAVAVPFGQGGAVARVLVRGGELMALLPAGRRAALRVLDWGCVGGPGGLGRVSLLDWSGRVGFGLSRFSRCTGFLDLTYVGERKE